MTHPGGYRYEDLELRPDDPLLPSSEYVAGFDDGWQDAHDLRPRLMETKAFGCGVVVGILLAVALIAASLATPRSAPDPTAPVPASNVAGLDLAFMVPAASASGPGPSGAPRPGDGLRPTAPGGAPSSPAVITGSATWYDAPTVRDAAAGPALRKALGPGWRDSTVEVCASRCIEVVLSDWCACGHGHVIDLDDRAFARLAPLSQGVVRVTITAAGLSPRRPTPPPTDVGP